MQINPEKIQLPDTSTSKLPLGYKKILVNDIPLLAIEERCRIYNRKYGFDTMLISGSSKPISKILR